MGAAQLLEIEYGNCFKWELLLLDSFFKMEAGQCFR